jgi:hypothetical protein
MFIKHKIRKTQRQPLRSLQPKQQENKKKTPKSNQTKQRIKGEAATKWGREGLVGCVLSPTVLVGVGLWVVPLSRSHVSLSATPSKEMK